MKQSEKIWCRTFQTALRIALPFLPYRTPLTLDGISALPVFLRRCGADRVLLVTDRGIRSRGISEPLESALERSNIFCAVYDGTVANPTTTNVAEALELYRKNGCKAIIGLGGGSSMDCAKATGARVARPNTPLGSMEGILRVRRALPPLIAIPTTAGTGSETTLAAVITDAETRHKYAINDFPLIPRAAVLDPELTRTLPPFITATTGLDALTHAVEAFIGRSTTRETRAAALEATELIFKYLDRAVEDGGDMEARRGMLRAAFLAGSAFSKSYVGYVHAVAHSLGGKYNTPHGLANAVLLPIVLESYGGAVTHKLALLAEAAGIACGTEEESAADFIAAIREKLARYGISEHLEGIDPADIPELARYAAREANPLYPVPVLMDAKELEKFYYLVMEASEDVSIQTGGAA